MEGEKISSFHVGEEKVGADAGVETVIGEEGTLSRRLDDNNDHLQWSWNRMQFPCGGWGGGGRSS